MDHSIPCTKCGSRDQFPSGGCRSCSTDYRRSRGVPPRTPKLDEAQVLEFLARDTTRGNLARAAAHFGVARSSITRILRRPEEREQREEAHDAKIQARTIKQLARGLEIAARKQARDLERAERRATAAERKQESTRLWRLRNLEEQRKRNRDRARQWRQEHPEAAREKDRQHREAHPYSSQQRRQEYLRAKERNAESLEQAQQERERVREQKREAQQRSRERKRIEREQKKAATLLSPCVQCGSVNRYKSGSCKRCTQEDNKRRAQENPGQVLARCSRYRARKYGAGFEFDPLIAHFYHRAHKQNTDGKNVHVDHIVPLANGGPHTIHNLRIVPALENLEKHAKVPSIDDLEAMIADHVTDPNYGVYWWIQAENAKSAAS